MKVKLLFLLGLLFCQITYAQKKPSSIVTGRLIKISPKLTDIKYSGPHPKNEKARKINEKDKANKRVRFAVDNDKAKSADKALQVKNMGKIISTSAPLTSFDAASAADNTTVFGTTFAPPDPNMCVGPNHIVQMVNSVHKVFDKSGNLIAGPLAFSSIATTAQDDGDPIVLYDHLADRWMLLQFNLPAGSESIIFCISQTSDPAGAYYVYEFPTVGVFPDYPHVGVWNNSYVITTHEFNLSGTAYLGQGFYGVDRTKMINGEPTSTLIRFQDDAEGGYLPVSLEGLKTPESSSPPMFTSFNSDEFGGSDELWLRTLNLDFNNPAASTLSARSSLPVASFDGRSPSSRSAVEQLGTTDGLDAIADRMMSRVIYRRFDNSESLVMNYAVNISGENPTSASTFQSGMRWYELTRPTPASAWTINQQSTYAPGVINGATGDNRWMGSVNIDQRGNIALGYSKSSSTAYPSINYAERRKGDALNTLGVEQTLIAGTGSQNGSGNRWGDYTSMAIDPTDEETLWFTDEYYATTSSYNWKTRIGSFRVSDPLITPAVHFKKGGTIARQAESITLPVGPPNLPYKDYLITLEIDQTPTQPVSISFNKSGTAIEGTDYNLIIPSPFTLESGTTTKDFTLRVYDNGLGEGDEFINIDYSLNINGGNAIAGNYNQKHRITIIGKTLCPTVNVAYTRPTTFCEGDSTVLNANLDPTYTYQWYRDDIALLSQTQAQLIVKQSGSYKVAITVNGCTIPSIPISVVSNLGVVAPTTVSRSVTAGTVLTAGNGLQASANCAGQSTASYNGPTIGFDGANQTAPDPTATISTTGTSLGKVQVSITWRKIDGADHTSCGNPGSGNSFDSEVSFQIVSPTNITVNLLSSGTYIDGNTTAGFVTTVFEDGGSVLGTVPASGTFNPAQRLSLFNGINPNGIWKLIARDAGSQDPLCVESFSVTVYTSASGAASIIKWYNASTGGTLVGTGNEYLPTDTAPGTYTYYAEANCTVAGLSCNTSLRSPATLTITGVCVSTAGTVSTDASVCSNTNAGTLTLNGHSGNIIRWESSTDNFATTSTIANTTSTLNYTNLSQTTKFRAVVQTGSCTIANSAPATITVNLISVTASNTGPYTVGQSIQLSAVSGGSMFSWSGPNAFSSTANPVIITNASLAMNGVYTVTVTQNICSATATTTVSVTEINLCTSIVDYDYVQAGNPFVYKFPLVNNMVIAEVPEQTSILVTPTCLSIPIESFRMKITGLPYLHEVIESIPLFALFNNTGNYVLGRNLSPGNYVLTITGYSQDSGLGNVVYGPVETNFTVVSNSATISAPTFAITSLCAGSSFNANFTASGVFNAGNQFDVQLSDANGTFDNPIVIGSTLSAGVVACTIPINIPLGANYQIRVVATNQTLSGNVNTSNLNAISSTLTLVSPTNDANGGTTTQQASQIITATNKVLSPANVIYKAGKSILLNAGFQANANSVFKAEIGGCN